MSRRRRHATRRHAIGALGVVGVLAAACGAGGAPAPPPPEPAGAAASDAGFFSVEQAARGRESFRRICAECHAISEFRGRDFEWTWRRQTAWDLFSEISWSMPEDNPGGLSPDTYADVIAYILDANRYRPGAGDLAPTRDAMSAVPLGPNADKTGAIQRDEPNR